MRPLTFISLFSGVGGFDLGFERAGMRCVAQVENNPHAITQLERHWPDVPRFEDVTDVGRHNLPAADLVCGGFPCQDVSVAGKRAGLAGARSGLWFQFHRILDEVAPRWVVIENVPGLLSSNGGRDFATLLHGLVELRYRVAWRVLDAQYFGVAQRRRRLFLVAHSTDGRAAEVLFERESGAWDSPPSRTAGQGATAPVKASAPSRRNGGSDPTAGDFVVAALSASGAGTSRTGNARTEAQMLVTEAAHSERMRGFGDYEADGVASNIQARDHKYATDLVAFTQNTREEVRQINGDGQIAGALGAEEGTHQRTYVAAIQPVAVGRKDSAGPQAKGWRDDGATWTLDGRGEADAVAYGLSTFETPKYAHELSPTIVTPSPTGGGQPPAVAVMDVAKTLTGNYGKQPDSSDSSTPGNYAISNYAVRRLTPVECSRLQGFPDEWTTGSDSARYQRLGNAVCVNVAEWIGRRMVALQESEG